MEHTSLPRHRALLRKTGTLVGELRSEWSRARVGGLSAEIAFFGLLGLFPAVIVFASALGSLDDIIGAGAAADVEEWFISTVERIFGSDNTLRSTITELFDRSNAGLITAGLVLIAYASARGFTAVVGALEVTYGHEHRRSWLSTRVMGFVITLATLLVAAMVAAMVVIGPLLGNGDELAERLGAGALFTTVWNVFRWPAVFAALVAWSTSVYCFAPRVRHPWRSGMPGAVVSTVWWIVVSSGFRVYLDVSARGANAVLGLLGGALTLLIWLYLLAMGLLVGAVANTMLAKRYQSTPSTEPAPQSE